MIKLSTSSNQVVWIQNVVYASKCVLNLHSLGQLQKNSITYHDDDEHMILKLEDKEIARAQHIQNLFILEQIKIGAIMSTQE